MSLQWSTYWSFECVLYQQLLLLFSFPYLGAPRTLFGLSFYTDLPIRYVEDFICKFFLFGLNIYNYYLNHTWDRKCFDGLWNLGDLDIVKKAIVRFELFVMKSTNNQNTIWSCKIATSSASQQCLNAQKRMPTQRDWTMNWNFAKHGWQSMVTERKRIGFFGIPPPPKKS